MVTQEGAMSRGMLGTSKKIEKARKHFLLEPPEGSSQANTLTLDSDVQKCKIMHSVV